MTEQAGGPTSPHPVDRLIRELLTTGRPASTDEVAHIIAHVSTTPFNPGRYDVPVRERGLTYQGHALSAREDSLVYHLTKRVTEGQWAAGTSASEYVEDLRRAVRAPNSRLAIYRRRGGAIATSVTPTVEVVPPARRTSASLPHLLVIYLADRGIILSGYQVSDLAVTGIPPEARWLK